MQVSDPEAQQAITDEPHDGLTRQDLIYEAKLSLLTAGIRAQIEQPAAQSVTPEQIGAYVDAQPEAASRAPPSPDHPGDDAPRRGASRARRSNAG